jgi:hypothetical protein
MVSFRYTFYDQLHEVFIAELPLKGPLWSETVNGAGTFEARIVVPEDPVLQGPIRTATNLDNSVVVTADNNVQPWSGYITKRKWDPSTNEVVITAQEWKTYFYRFIIAPWNEDPESNYQVYNDWDQLTLAQFLAESQILSYYGEGAPYIDATENKESGVDRDLLVVGNKFRTLGSWIDSMANRDRGFEWDVQVRQGDDGPLLWFETYFPERGGVIDGLEFSYGETGNILSYEPPEENSDELVRRQWALGEGPTSEVQPYARDEDPALANDEVLIFDKATSWSGVQENVTLAQHARAERQFYSRTLDMFQFTVSMNRPHAYTYNVGDRCRLKVKDRWLDLSYDTVRIIQRDVYPEQQVVKITVDLSDDVLPEIDVDGVV